MGPITAMGACCGSSSVVNRPMPGTSIRSEVITAPSFSATSSVASQSVSVGDELDDALIE